ncbi:unnamed protein product [Phytophthora fragariaefolia]|uniref:Unnamed protein product n=1 Tax=Phytophthora fragariaefolia TaxID=1490495 RepID=A0A9W6WWU5_9STRA|nr:unnamed protein product [Phytophthora fragariaefolia]
MSARPEVAVDVRHGGYLYVKRGLLKVADKRYYFVARRSPELYSCKDETSFNLWLASGHALEPHGGDAVAKASGLIPVLVGAVLRADGSTEEGGGGSDKTFSVMVGSASKCMTLRLGAATAEKAAQWLEALQEVQVTKRNEGRQPPGKLASASDKRLLLPLNEHDALRAADSSARSAKSTSEHGDNDGGRTNGDVMLFVDETSEPVPTKPAPTSVKMPRVYAGGKLQSVPRVTDDDEATAVSTPTSVTESSPTSASENVEVPLAAAPALNRSRSSSRLNRLDSCSSTASGQSQGSNGGNVLLFVPVAGSALTASASRLAKAQQELDALVAKGAKLPSRVKKEPANGDAIEWRYGAPEYVLTDLAYVKGRIREPDATPLASYVEECCQTFIMEATHKTRYNQWHSVRQDCFYLQVNDGVRVPGSSIRENDMLGLLYLGDIEASAGADQGDSDESQDPRAELAEAFPDGFPMEVLDVFTQPPQCYFSWRHWGPFTGKFRGVKGDGSKVEVRGFGEMSAPLVVPRFDDEDDSSSSESDDEEAATNFGATLNKRYTHYSDPSNNNADDDHGESTASSDKAEQDQPQQTFKGNVQWDHVQELQELTNANATLTSEARDLRQQIQLEAQAPVPGLDVDAVQDILLEKDNIEHVRATTYVYFVVKVLLLNRCNSLQDVRDVKIVHQAKTLRTLKRAMQREKQIAADATKQCKAFEAANKKLEEDVDTLKLKLQRFQARAAADKVTSNGYEGAQTANQQQEEQVSSTEAGSDSGPLKKLCEELKSKNLSLQQELKRTQRALIREVGDDVSIEDIIGNKDGTASGASRRGRAQHIIMLKAKVKKLQAQLAMIKPATASIDSQESVNQTTVLDVDQRAQQDLSGQQIHRQKLLDQLTHQRDELQERVHRLTRKYDALKARAQILDREKQETRNKFQVLVEKSRTDDALVDALQRQLDTWKAKLHEARRARTADAMKGSSSPDERAELERLRKIVAEHKSRGGDRATVQSNTMMPQLSEASQYRALAAEKERLTEIVRELKAQLEEKDRQMRCVEGHSTIPTPGQIQPTPPSPSLPPIGDESPGGKSANGSLTSAGPPVPLAIMMEQQQQQLKHEMEILRKTFRESIREKDERIAELEQLHHAANQASIDSNSANEMAQELLDLQEENEFLRQEFDKLKTRYEAFIKPPRPEDREESTTKVKRRQ